MALALTRLFTSPEFQKANHEAMARGLWNADVNAFTPGMGWEMNWIYDPISPDEHMSARRERGIRGEDWLSVHYWRDWSLTRPPITVVCPNGEQWCFDQKSTNGPGWIVTGTWPIITASPSIVVSGYHGWLRDGTFSDDVEGRGPSGVARPYAPRVAA